MIGKRTLVYIALVGLLGFASRAHALTPEVRDGAGFFKPETVARANEIIKEVEQRYKKDLLVETVPHVPERERQEATSSDPHVKDRFFVDWADRRARDEGVNGIYVLITREPGHVEVAVGNRTRTEFPDEERHRLVEILLNHFKKKEYDEGLLEAVRYVQSTLAAHTRVGGAPSAGSEHPGLSHETRGIEASWGLWHWLGLGLAVLFGVWLLSAVVRALAGGGGQPGGYTGPGGSAGYGPAGPGGGFFPSLMGGLFGAVAGSWLYDRFFSGESVSAAAEPTLDSAPAPEDTDYTAEGGDFDTTGSSGGDSGGGDLKRDDDSAAADAADGGDFDGDDSGGDDSGGGDF